MRKFIFVSVCLFVANSFFCQYIEWVDTVVYSEQSNKICFGDNQSVYIAGQKGISPGGGNQGSCYRGTFLHKYSPNRELLWKDATQSDGIGPQSAGVASDSEGSVYTGLWNSGESNTIQIGNTVYPGGVNGFLVKYNSTGQIQWINFLAQTIVNDISVNNEQQIVLACNNNIRVFDSAGNQISTIPYCATGKLDVDPNDAVYASCTYIQKIYAGSLQWTYPLSGNYSFTSDKYSNCYVSTLGNPDCSSSILKIKNGEPVFSFTVPYWGANGVFMNSIQKLFVLGASGPAPPPNKSWTNLMTMAI